MAYFLDATGLNTFWTQVKLWLENHYTDRAFNTITTQDSSGNNKQNGTITASSIEDTLSLREGTGITFGVDASRNQLTINTTGEANQNAFSTVNVAGTSLAADSPTDTLTITAGSNITLTPTANSDSFTIAATDTTYNNATTDTAGLMSADDKTKLNGIATGAQVNVIETVKKNGTALTVTNKTVDISVPTKTSDITNDSNFAVDASYVHTDNNYTTSEKTKLSCIATGAQVNVIESVKVNGTALTVTSKAVDITVPTNNNQLTNGAGYQTAAQVASAISTAISSAYIYKGSVADEASLPSSGQVTGDVYNIVAASSYGPAGMNVAWNGSSWDALGSSISVEAISTTTISDIVDQTGDYAPTP